MQFKRKIYLIEAQQYLTNQIPVLTKTKLCMGTDCMDPTTNHSVCHIHTDTGALLIKNTDWIISNSNPDAKPENKIIVMSNELFNQVYEPNI